MKYLIATFILCLCATSVSAEILDCRQTSLSTNGFKSKKAAQSWFPKRFKIQIDGEKALSDVYGMGTVSERSGRKIVTFVTATAKGRRTQIIVTYIPKSSRYSARLGALARYAQTPGAKGKCRLS